jgi:hypothetical protein
VRRRRDVQTGGVLTSEENPGSVAEPGTSRRNPSRSSRTRRGPCRLCSSMVPRVRGGRFRIRSGVSPASCTAATAYPRNPVRHYPSNHGAVWPLQVISRIDTFNHNHQLINTNTLLTETAQGTISVGSNLLLVKYSFITIASGTWTGQIHNHSARGKYRDHTGPISGSHRVALLSHPAPGTAGCGGASAAGGASKEKAVGGATKKQVSMVSLGSSASGALSAVSQQGQSKDANL